MITLYNATSEIYVPDGLPIDKALARTTHMGIGAHQDDLEFMSLHGILECFQSSEKWFTGVTVTNGAGSSRINQYANYTDEQMQIVRRQEQKKAAYVGEYGAMVQLDYSSAKVKDPAERKVIEDLKSLFSLCEPEFVYTHNPADKHDTHIGVMIPVIQALRELPGEKQPSKVYGCEVWRALDWMLDEDKVLFDISGRENVSMSLMGLFDSQISGGKRYDSATIGRKRNNATYLASHQSDRSTLLEFAMDLTPLIKDPSLCVVEYTRNLIRRFENDVAQRLSKRLSKK